MHLKLTPQSEYSFLQANYHEIHNDIKYFLLESDKAFDLEIGKRFARIAIILTAFYVESLANLVKLRIEDAFGCLCDFEKFVDGGHWPRPLNILLGAYIKFQNKNKNLTNNMRRVRSVKKVYSHRINY